MSQAIKVLYTAETLVGTAHGLFPCSKGLLGRIHVTTTVA